MTLDAQIIAALRELGEGNHSTGEVWWQVRDAATSGTVERVLWDLWEQRRVENPKIGRWSLPAEQQMTLNREG